ncbi:putative glycosyl hydrolase family 61 protein 6 [Elsinoe fawcettii]|nr:putative glycosyl hydrolase family 61 protein 6 [Elsinoe fawcettii]
MHSPCLTLSVFASLSLVPLVLAHGFVHEIVVDNQRYQGYDILTQWWQPQDRPVVAGWSIPNNKNNGYVSDYESDDMICHIGATPGQTSIKASAGDEVTLHWTEWPRLHPGPVITYIANCNGACETVDKKTLKFTKIDEDGLHSAKPMHWATDTLIDNNNTWVMKLPTDIATGNYVLRHEIIALQGAVNQNGAQVYPSCLNFQIEGPGPKTFNEGTSPTTFYDANAPNIKIQVFYDVTKNYTIPGPPLGAGAGGSAAPAPAPSLEPTPSPEPIPSPAPVKSAADEDAAAATTPVPEASQTFVPPGTLPVISEAPAPSTTAAPEPAPAPTSAPGEAPAPPPSSTAAPVETTAEPAPEPTASEPSPPAPTSFEPSPPAPTYPAPAPTEPAPQPSDAPTRCTETRTITATRPGTTGTGRPGAVGGRRYRQMVRWYRSCVAGGKSQEECLSALVKFTKARAQKAQKAQKAQQARAQYAQNSAGSA